ncbi:hypothetical protein Acsp02_91580 [Actinoplanes sp. NBRC 103695]|nr:hypothetical protein Acsp02_91580 [Actinoplanes sp. NBRC 103695]
MSGHRVGHAAVSGPMAASHHNAICAHRNAIPIGCTGARPRAPSGQYNRANGPHARGAATP